MIKIECIDEAMGNAILEEVIKAIESVCDKHNLTVYPNGAHLTCSGLGIGVQIIGKVEGLEKQQDDVCAYALGVEQVTNVIGVGKEDYGKKIKIQGDEYVFIGLRAAGHVKYNFHQLVGKDQVSLVFRGEGGYYITSFKSDEGRAAIEDMKKITQHVEPQDQYRDDEQIILVRKQEDI